MTVWTARARALMGVSCLIAGAVAAEPVLAQQAGTAGGQSAPTARNQAANGQATKRAARTRQQQVVQPSETVRAAHAQAATSTQSLDAITVTASKTEEQAISALAPVSVVSQQQIETQQPRRISDLFYNIPGVWFQDRGDDPTTAINIRGLQDFGRVAVVVDGARQNYQRSGHNANGSFFLDPELIGSVDITRGPTANIYGSGAIGGVAAFRTKDIDDVVRAGERWGVDMSGTVGSNQTQGTGSVFGGIRALPSVDLFGGVVYRSQSNYKDGNGTEVGNSGAEIASGLFKTTIRPADGHEIKFGAVYQDYSYTIGQENRGPVATAAQRTANQGSSVYDSRAKNFTGTATWKYSRPDDNLFDFSATLYGNQTLNDQTKVYHYSTSGSAYCGPGNAGNNISGCVGDKRSYRIDTVGFDIHNTSRFMIGDWRTALTYGGDLFRDQVDTWDQRGNSNITTPGGERTVSGAFIQAKNNYSNWLEVIAAARYDHYELSSLTTTSSGSRLSPKITVGVTPVAGFTPYASYAEGYRAPSITETLIAGGHATGGGPNLFNCPDGTSGLFCFLPNPGLRPEVGKNKEIGVNLKYDAIFTAEDSFRGKLNVFRNDVDDYIDLVASTPTRTMYGFYSQYYQYQNIPAAQIEGFEADLSYDAGIWFVGVTATLQRGKNTATDVGLATVQPRKVTTTAGVRLLDRKLTASLQWASVGANTDIPAGYVPSTSYDLLNMYVTYQPTRDITLNLALTNMLNQYYRPFAVPGSSTDGTSQNDLLWTSAGAGFTVKGGLKIHFGGA